MRAYIKAQKETNDAIISNVFSDDELQRFSKSDLRWAENKRKGYQTRKVKKGEIYQIEFGKNYEPEMSYEHRGLVIGVKDKLLHVLPIYSYNPTKHTDVYHPVDFPNSKSDLFLLKGSEFSWLKHDSILKLSDIRTVSINRVLYKHDGKIDTASSTYKSIETLVLRKYFAGFYHKFEEQEKTIAALREDIASLENEKKLLLSEIEKLKAMQLSEV